VETTDITRIRLDVPKGYAENQRLDVYITQFIENATRNKVQEGIRDGFVQVNGRLGKASQKVMAGDAIEITLPKPPPPEAEPENIPLDILFEDESLVIVNKAAGMVVHPAFGNWSGTMVNALLHHVGSLSDLDEDEDMPRPGIVHRLDKDTSGVMVVAKTDTAHARLAARFAKHDIDRHYRAVVWGTPPAEGTFTGNIGRSRADRKKMAVVPDGEGKHAVTHFKVVEYFDHLALVDVWLETGRTHQIRVHFAHHGFPVFGDRQYGGDHVRYGSNTGARKSMFDNLMAALGRQCLHAQTLGFPHPATSVPLRFEAEPPGDFRHVIEQLRRFCAP